VLKRLLWLVCFLALPGALHGQSCVPPVQLGQRIKAPIHNVVITNDGIFPPEKEDEIAKRLRSETVDPDSLDKDMSSMAEEAAERARAAYQDLGYFKVQVHGKAESVVTNPPQYDIMIQIRSVGEQYRLGDLNIVKAASFPTQQLRDLFPIQRGEIFSRERIAKGLEELRRIYGSQGYINFTSVPETQFDDANGTVDLNIDVDEGKQFRVRSVQVLGLDSEAEARVSGDIELKPGDVYSSEAWERSFTKFHDLAHNPEPNADKRLDEKDGWVDVVLDFRKPPTCPIELSTESAIPLRGLPSAEQH